MAYYGYSYNGGQKRTRKYRARAKYSIKRRSTTNIKASYKGKAKSSYKNYNRRVAVNDRIVNRTFTETFDITADANQQTLENITFDLTGSKAADLADFYQFFRIWRIDVTLTPTTNDVQWGGNATLASPFLNDLYADCPVYSSVQWPTDINDIQNQSGVRWHLCHSNRMNKRVLYPVIGETGVQENTTFTGMIYRRNQWIPSGAGLEDITYYGMTYWFPSCPYARTFRQTIKYYVQFKGAKNNT